MGRVTGQEGKGAKWEGYVGWLVLDGEMDALDTSSHVPGLHGMGTGFLFLFFSFFFLVWLRAHQCAMDSIQRRAVILLGF